MSKLAKLVMIQRIRAGDKFTYVAVLGDADAPEMQRKLSIDPIHLLSYVAMQKHVLSEAGVMLVNEAVEGRIEPDADRVWKIVSSRVFVDADHQHVN